MIRIRVIFICAVIGVFFVIFTGGFLWEKIEEEKIRSEIESASYDNEYTSEAGAFIVKYPKGAQMKSATTSAVTITHRVNKNITSVECTVQGVYEPEKQLFLSDFEIPKNNTKRVIVNEIQWVYSKNSNPQWIMVEGGHTYTLSTRDSMYDIVFCERILETFRTTE